METPPQGTTSVAQLCGCRRHIRLTQPPPPWAEPLAGLSTHSGERKVPGEKEAREEDDGSGEGCPLEYLLQVPGPGKG